MADNTIDVMMRVVGTSGEFAADSLTSPVANDELQKDFRAGYFCDLLEFSFSAGSGSQSKQSKEKDKLLAMQTKLANLNNTDAPPKPKWQKSNELLVLDHVQKQRRQADKRRVTADVMDMKEVEFTRIMDSASTLLFKALVNCETVKQITIIKRKAAGVDHAGLAYLRLDFKQVLMTRIDWKDEQNVVHESGTFIYRSLKMQYRPQLASGALGAIVPMEWAMTSAG